MVRQSSKVAARTKTRPPLSEVQKVVLFASLLSDPTMFTRARVQVGAEHFLENEGHLRVLWQFCLKHFNKHFELPSLTECQIALHTAAERNPDDVTDENLEQAQTLFDLIEAGDIAKVRPEDLREYLQFFLEDRFRDQMREHLIAGQTPEDLAQTLSEYREQVVSIRSAANVGELLPFGENWLEEQQLLRTRSSGIGFIDAMLNGGTSAQEIYGVLGPYGGGKSLLGVMITTEAARQSYLHYTLRRNELAEEYRRARTKAARAEIRKQRDAVPLELAFHFSYEEPITRLRSRALAYVAEIPFDRIALFMNAKHMNMLSSAARGDYQEYERRRYQDLLSAGQRPPGEQERLQLAIEMLNACWRAMDMMGGDRRNPGAGRRGIPEIAAAIEAATRPTKKGVCTVMVDYLLVCLERDENYDARKELRHHIRQFAMNLRDQVATPYETPCWVLHQLAAAENASSPGKAQHGSSAAEGKAFIENTAAAFTIGVQNAECQCLFSQPKARNSLRSPSIVLRMQGDTARFVHDQAFVYDPASQSIVSRREQAQAGAAVSPVATAVAAETTNQVRRRISAARRVL